MCDAMTFPDTAEEFMEQYKIVDTEHVYTNGAELIPIFRMKQWLEHLQDIESEQKRGKWIDRSGGIEGAWNYCSVCGEQAIDIYYFYPNCGTYMGDDTDEID